MARFYSLDHGDNGGSVLYSASPAQWKDAQKPALEKMPCRKRRHYRGGIYSRLYRQPDVSSECLGLLFPGWKSIRTGVSSVLRALVFVVYSGYGDFQRFIPVEREGQTDEPSQNPLKEKPAAIVAAGFLFGKYKDQYAVQPASAAIVTPLT